MNSWNSYLDHEERVDGIERRVEGIWTYMRDHFERLEDDRRIGRDQRAMDEGLRRLDRSVNHEDHQKLRRNLFLLLLLNIVTIGIVAALATEVMWP